MISWKFCRGRPDNAASGSLLEFRQLLVSDIVRDSVAAIETRGGWRLVVTRAYRALALPVSMRAMVIEVGPEIEQLVFQICRRPEQHVI